ncbi:uncharacterized protein LOC143244091 isoform X2 [Tachypleus tridentatus]|uniref:uncharacterized protein LOC143244091 isoform X2 n=1 Tax=Tachypleus tridentatus TaxID=6853 RepID=UPI003FD31EB2
MSTSEKQNKTLTTKSTLRRFTEHVKNGNIEKIEKFFLKGLDPNFQCPDNRETPLTLAATLHQPRHVIMVLINGGARFDFTNSDGRTALHRAVESNNCEALKTLLDLGASPNLRDNRKLTPLYYTVICGCDNQLTKLLLQEYADLGSADHQGWQEVHQACKHGRVQQLELLLLYGADPNCRNASGNTPLHICAVNEQRECAKVLLSWGVDKNAMNYANQDPYQVAVIAGNLQMADMISNHNVNNVVPYREAPRFNQRRPISAVRGSKGDQSGLEAEFISTRVLPESTISSKTSGKETGTKDESKVGGASDREEVTEKNIHPGATCVCIRSYSAGSPGHLPLNSGDYVEVVGISDCGLLEGRLVNGQEGFFPSSCVREVKPKTEDVRRGHFRSRRVLPLRRVNSVPKTWKMNRSPRTVVLHKGKKGFGFVLRGAKATSPLVEKQKTYAWPSLQYLDDVDPGGVADQAGLKKGDFVLEINGHNITQATHDQVVSIIRQSGDLVTMTVVTDNNPPETRRSFNQRESATVPRRMSVKKAPTPPKRDPGTTLSFGRALARSMVTGLADIDSLEDPLQNLYFEAKSAKNNLVVSGKDGESQPSTEQEILGLKQESNSSIRTSTEETVNSEITNELETMLHPNRLLLLGKKSRSWPELTKTFKCQVRDKMFFLCKRSQSYENLYSLSTKGQVNSWTCPPYSYKNVDLLNNDSDGCPPQPSSQNSDEDNPISPRTLRPHSILINAKDDNLDKQATRVDSIEQKSGEICFNKKKYLPQSIDATNGQGYLHEQKDWPQSIDATNKQGYFHEQKVWPQSMDATNEQGYFHEQKVWPQSMDATNRQGYFHEQKVWPQSMDATNGQGYFHEQKDWPQSIDATNRQGYFHEEKLWPQSMDATNGQGYFYEQKDWPQSIDATNGQGYFHEEKVWPQSIDAINGQGYFHEENVWPQSIITRNEATPLLHKPRQPPNQPPPAPPKGKVVRVDISNSQGEYANIEVFRNRETSVMSSFRPGDNAKLYVSPESLQRDNAKFFASLEPLQRDSVNLYASPVSLPGDSAKLYVAPESLMNVGYKPFNQNKILQHPFPRIVTRPQSVPPRGMRHQTSSESESSGDTSGFYGSLICSQKRTPVGGGSRHLRVKNVLSNQSSFGSPAHYPVLHQKSKSHFSKGLECDSSEDEELSSSLNITGRLSTFGKTEENSLNCRPWQLHSEVEKLKQIMVSQAGPNRSKYPFESYSFDLQRYSQSSNQAKILRNYRSLQSSSENYYTLQKSKSSHPSNGGQSNYEPISCPYTRLHQHDTKEGISGISVNSIFESKPSKAKTLLHEPINRSSTLPNPKSSHFESDEQDSVYTNRVIQPSRSYPSNLTQEDWDENEISPKDVVNKSELIDTNSMEYHIVNTNGYISCGTETEGSYIEGRYRQLPFEKSVGSTGLKKQKTNVLINSCSPTSQSKSVNAGSSTVGLLQSLPPPPECGVVTPTDDHLATMIFPPPEFSDGIFRLGIETSKKGTSQRSTSSSSHPNSNSNVLVQFATDRVRDHSVVDGAKLKKFIPARAQQFLGQDHPRFTSNLSADTTRSAAVSGGRPLQKSEEREFRRKPLQNWSTTDVSHWLDSLFLSQYKSVFLKAGINGAKLANMDNNDLVGLGVKLIGHRLNIERSMKCYINKY